MPIRIVLAGIHIGRPHLAVPASLSPLTLALASESSPPGLPPFPLPVLPVLLDSPDPEPDPLSIFLCGTSSRATSDPPMPSSPSLFPVAILTLAISSASRSVSPVSSSAAKNLASSLHSSQSSSLIALLSSLTLCSDADDSSSNVCRMSRYPPAVFKLPR